MGLAESLSIRTPGNTPGVCPLGKIAAKLNDEDQVALISAIDSAMSYRDIMLALRREGHKISTNSILEHRRKVCVCNWGTK